VSAPGACASRYLHSQGCHLSWSLFALPDALRHSCFSQKSAQLDDTHLSERQAAMAVDQGSHAQPARPPAPSGAVRFPKQGKGYCRSELEAEIVLTGLAAHRPAPPTARSQGGMRAQA
jgi:hypothetical protein